MLEIDLRVGGNYHFVFVTEDGDRDVVPWHLLGGRAPDPHRRNVGCSKGVQAGTPSSPRICAKLTDVTTVTRRKLAFTDRRPAGRRDSKACKRASTEWRMS